MAKKSKNTHYVVVRHDDKHWISDASWSELQPIVQGNSEVAYTKGFKSEPAAQRFLDQLNGVAPEPEPQASVQAQLPFRQPGLPSVIMYTDGACSGNPGPGGWAAILTLDKSDYRKEFSGAVISTTNNRMELTAVIQGLLQLKTRSAVLVVTDSKYVAQGAGEWLDGWKRRGWKTAAKKPVKNKDLWQQLDALLSKHRVRFQWVKGHAGHPMNERADQLAVAAIHNMNNGG